MICQHCADRERCASSGFQNTHVGGMLEPYAHPWVVFLYELIGVWDLFPDRLRLIAIKILANNVSAQVKYEYVQTITTL